MSFLLALVGIGSLICFIIVLIKLFQAKGPVHGILGLLCALYTFIWGWINVDRLNIRNIMLIWSGLLVASVVLNILIGGSAPPRVP